MGQTEISGCCYVKNGEWDVVDFACVKSRRVGILHNLSDMHRKPLASFGLCVDRVPVAYHRRDTCSIKGIVSKNNIEHCITHWSGPPVIVLMTVVVVTDLLGSAR
jgi:hypothetical protein